MESVRQLSSLTAARGEWTALAAGTGNIFSTWEWAAIWWRHFGCGTLDVRALVRDGRTIAILPTHHSRWLGIRVSRLLGHGVADELGPVCGAADAAEAIGLFIRSHPRGTVLLLDRLREERVNGAEGRSVWGEPSPVIDLAAYGSWDAYLAAKSSNFRKEVRRRARRVGCQLGVTFRLASDPDRLDADIDALLALHAERWGPASGSFSGPREAFHREFAACALERGWLRLWLAEVEGTPVAADYGFRFGDVDCAYQAGRASAWNGASIGAALTEHAIREAFADGMREYRLLRGGESYKVRYATGLTRLITLAAGGEGLARVGAAAMGMMGESAKGRRALRLEH